MRFLPFSSRTHRWPTRKTQSRMRNIEQQQGASSYGTRTDLIASRIEVDFSCSAYDEIGNSTSHASCSSKFCSCSSTSSARVLLETNFKTPSGVNCAPDWDETKAASLPGSMAAFSRNLMLMSSRLRSTDATPIRPDNSFNEAYCRRFCTAGGGAPKRSCSSERTSGKCDSDSTPAILLYIRKRWFSCGMYSTVMRMFSHTLS